MENKPTIKTILIPDLDKPEYHAMTKTITSFMEQRDIKAITKALPAMIADYELVKWKYEAEKEEHAKNNRDNYEARKKLSERIVNLERRDKITTDFLTSIYPQKNDLRNRLFRIYR
jgi:hypothetical protein